MDSTGPPVRSAIAALLDHRAFHVVRVLLALVILPVVLVEAWGRAFMLIMIDGRPELHDAVVVLGTIGLVMALTAGLSARLNSRRTDWLVLCGVLLQWILIEFAASYYLSGKVLPKRVIVPSLVLSAMWVPCCAWMFYRPWPWRWRIVGLAACVSLTVAFTQVFRIDGVSGGLQVDFNWKTAPFFEPGSRSPKEVAITPVDLMRTTPEDYPQFLGPGRTGVIAASNLSEDWETKKPHFYYRYDVGAGWGGFAIVGGYGVTQEQRGENECVVCYDLETFHSQWVHSDTARFESTLGGIGPRATPTIADGRVYSVGGTGILNCLDGSTGNALWTVKILEDNGGRPIDHGVCGSPLVTGELVIVAPTGVSNASLAAYHRVTGQRVWRGGSQPASYGSPALVELAGTPQVLIATENGIEGCDLQTGKSLWHYAWVGNTHVNCSQPLIVDARLGRVLYCTGYDKGSVLFDVAVPGAGDFVVNPVWTSPGKMKTKFTTAVLYQGFVYGLDDGILACLDITTGKQMWKGGRYKHGQILLAGDLLLVQAESGEVFLVKPNPKGLIELGRIPALNKKTWNNPALAGNRLVVRNDRKVACFILPKRENPPEKVD